ncbi:MAG: RnfABCDGE type electron transport complex subunit B [Phycisphaerae bacterium]|nr:RnfABCDGE type electron transport complex subunit B [Phycisphaerae bacterium]
MILAEILQLWNSAWPSGVTMLALGGGFALVLLIAHERLKVGADPKIDALFQALPHLDCGGCGFAGCSSYAKALASDPSLIGKCGPGGAGSAAKLAAVLSIQATASQVPARAVVHCNGYAKDKAFYGTYEGIASCTAANALANVQACKFGCLGFGDCVRACKFDALHVVDGLSTVDYSKCTGCTACSKACPRNLIRMVPFSQDRMIVVACNSRENGKTTRSMCKAGCIGCGLCTRQSDLFAVQDNLSSVDYTRYRTDEGTDKAMAKCPSKVIVWRGKTPPAV